MSQNDFISEIKTIPHSQATVYEYLTDLNNMEQFKEQLKNPAIGEQLTQAAEKYNVHDLNDKLDKITFDHDSMTLANTPVGTVSLRIVERESPKTIKFQGENSPVGVMMWIQLLPAEGNSCKMRLTLRAELNMLIRNMVSKHLKQGVETIANVLAVLPYKD